MPMSRRGPKAWDSTIHDLSVHRASRGEIEQRHKMMQSPNVEAGKAELEKRRRQLARGSFDYALAAIAGETAVADDETADALKQLDDVQAQLQRLADDTEDAPAPVPKRSAVRPIVTPISIAAVAGIAPEECVTPPTPEPSLIFSAVADLPAGGVARSLPLRALLQQTFLQRLLKP